MKRTFLMCFLLFVAGLKDVTSYSQDSVPPECNSSIDCFHRCGILGSHVCKNHQCVCLSNGEQKRLRPHVKIDKNV
ncbi:unnamed protein product [Lactuca virosa]|uniref:Uncharacterized protein n=1 Tax=Lactuca virosa TaxID=75947 RepID=A0AAU9P8J1_9ASTR|nr:unnamed protein product [Lactuca virosa]